MAATPIRLSRSTANRGSNSEGREWRLNPPYRYLSILDGSPSCGFLGFLNIETADGPRDAGTRGREGTHYHRLQAGSNCSGRPD